MSNKLLIDLEFHFTHGDPLSVYDLVDGRDHITQTPDSFIVERFEAEGLSDRLIIDASKLNGWRKVTRTIQDGEAQPQA